MGAFSSLLSPATAGSEELRTVAITTEPNDVVEPVHDRMPVMLKPGDEATWLESDDEDDLLGLLDPYADELTDAYEISTEVNNLDNDSPDIL